MRKKNKLTVTLLLGTIILWALIIYKIVIYFASGDEDLLPTKKSAVSKDTGILPDTVTNFIYTALERDPFEFGKQQERKDTAHIVKRNIPIVKKEMLNYKINGILLNGESKVVVLEDLSSGGTFFLKEGESYKSIKIKNIYKDKVIVSEDKSLKEIYLTK